MSHRTPWILALVLADAGMASDPCSELGQERARVTALEIERDERSADLAAREAERQVELAASPANQTIGSAEERMNAANRDRAAAVAARDGAAAAQRAAEAELATARKRLQELESRGQGGQGQARELERARAALEHVVQQDARSKELVREVEVARATMARILGVDTPSPEMLARLQQDPHRVNYPPSGELRDAGIEVFNFRQSGGATDASGAGYADALARLEGRYDALKQEALKAQTVVVGSAERLAERRDQLAARLDDQSQQVLLREASIQGAIDSARRELDEARADIQRVEKQIAAARRRQEEATSAIEKGRADWDQARADRDQLRRLATAEQRVVEAQDRLAAIAQLVDEVRVDVERLAASCGGGRGSWSAGSPQTLSGTTPGSAPAPTRPASEKGLEAISLVRQIEAAMRACRYLQARALADSLATIDPGNPWLASVEATLFDQAALQEDVLARVDMAEAMRSVGNYAGAKQELDAISAPGRAPACMRDAIARARTALGDAVVQANATRSAAAREGARAALGGLIGLAQAIGQARSEPATGPQRSSPPTTGPSQGTGPGASARTCHVTDVGGGGSGLVSAKDENGMRLWVVGGVPPETLESQRIQWAAQFGGTITTFTTATQARTYVRQQCP